MKGIFQKISMRGSIYYCILLILVAKICSTGLRIDFLMNSEVGHFMVHVINFERDSFLHNLKVAFNKHLDLK